MYSKGRQCIRPKTNTQAEECYFRPSVATSRLQPAISLQESYNTLDPILTD